MISDESSIARRIDPSGSSSTISRWSTDGVPKRQRLDYWVEAISNQLFQLSSSTDVGNSFGCRLAVAPLDGFMVALAEGSRHASFRTRSLVRRSTDHSFHLVVDYAKPWFLAWNGDHILMSPGDLVLTDSLHVHGGFFPNSCRVTNIKVRADWLLRWVRHPARLVGKRIDGRQGWGSTLSAFLAQLTPLMAARTPLPARLIGDQVGAILAMLENQQERCSNARPKGRAHLAYLAKVEDVVRQRLAEPLLNADDVAESLKIPVVSLHKWMGQSGSLFGSVLQRERVLKASEMLSSRKFDDLSVPEIGRRVGLPDTSHFAELIRKHLGESPLTHRRSSITAADPSRTPELQATPAKLPQAGFRDAAQDRASS